MTPSEFVDFLMEGREVGLEIRRAGRDKKGVGVFATKPFKKGDFICKYKGDLISVDEAEERCTLDPGRANYQMKVERHRKKQEFVVDASHEVYASTFGRSINHDSEDVNIIPRVIDIPKYATSIVYFVALRDIGVGEELAYHYGDRRKDSDLKDLGKPQIDLKAHKRSFDLREFRDRRKRRSALGKSGKTHRFYKSVRKPLNRKSINVD